MAFNALHTLIDATINIMYSGFLILYSNPIVYIILGVIGANMWNSSGKRAK